MKNAAERATKYLPGQFEVKATDEGERTFEGILSTSHLDLGDMWGERDIVWPGAFKRTLDHFRKAKDPYIPLVDTHKYQSVMNAFGHLVEGEEVLTGKTLEYEMESGGMLKVPEMALHTKWKVIEGLDGDRLLDRLRGKAVRRMSMGYDPVKEDFTVLKAYGRTRNLREVALAEGSLTIFAMQPNATVDHASVKSLLDGFRDGTLTDEDLAQIRDLPPEMKQKFRALLEEAPPAPDADTPPEGLAPEDPRRVAMAAKLRGLKLQSLALSA